MKNNQGQETVVITAPQFNNADEKFQHYMDTIPNAMPMIVYGTLQRQGGNTRLMYQADGVFIEEVKVLDHVIQSLAMWEVKGEYCWAELWIIDGSKIAPIDRLEGYTAGTTRGNIMYGYWRVPVDAMLPTGTKVKAAAYENGVARPDREWSTYKKTRVDINYWSWKPEPGVEYYPASWPQKEK